MLHHPLNGYPQLLSSVFPLGNYKRRYIFDAQKIVAMKSLQDGTLKPNLDGFAFELISLRVMIGVPLQPDARVGQGVFPALLIVIDFCFKGGVNGLA